MPNEPDQALKLLHDASVAISEADDFEEALAVVLKQVCLATGWDYGEAWIPEPGADWLVCSPAWFGSGLHVAEFRRRTEGLTLGSGEGLPGRVWASRRPEWQIDVSQLPEDRFSRSGAASELGLKAGFAVPIVAAGEVLAILAFFMGSVRGEDRRLIDVVTTVAVQLGPLVQRKRAEEALAQATARLQSTERTLEAVSGLIAAADGSNVREVILSLATQARQVTKADYAAILTFDLDGAVEHFVYDGVKRRRAALAEEFPTGRGLLGELARRDEPIRIDDVRLHPTFTGWPPGHPPMAAFLGVPIRAGRATIGSLYLTRRPGASPFSDSDELAATILALRAALGIAFALARARYGRLSLMEERVRLAQERHDGTLQALFAHGLQWEALSGREDFPPDVREHLRLGVSTINHLIGDMREQLTLLQAEPPPRQPQFARDIAAVLRELVPGGVDTVVNMTPRAVEALAGWEGAELLSIAREAISNSVLHGSPSRIAVDFRHADSGMRLTIQDDGIGFDTVAAEHGLGMVAIRNHVERLGAELTIFSIPGMGTTIQVWLATTSR
jgi:signal transduction histidine kinase